MRFKAKEEFIKRVIEGDRFTTPEQTILTGSTTRGKDDFRRNI
jgi:hypothetical protein